MRGREIKNERLCVNESSKWAQRLEPNKTGGINTLTTVSKDNLLLLERDGKMTLRNLTPKECWRFMGYSDEDFNKASEVCTDTQLCRQAGNAIALPVLEGVFGNLF